MDESKLVARAAGGDKAAFEQLVLAYQQKIYNLALRMTGDREEAYDLSQETFLKAWHAIGLFQADSKFSTWLFRIASNCCIDYLRRHKKRKTVSMTTLEGESEDETYQREIADTKWDPARLAEKRAQWEEVKAAILSLPQEFRIVLVLRAVDGLRYDEIAEVLDLSPGTVKSRLARARIKVYQQLSGNNPDDFASKR